MKHKHAGLSRQYHTSHAAHARLVAVTLSRYPQDEEKAAAQELTTVPMPEIQAAIKAEEEAAIAKGETPYAASWKMRTSR